MYQFHCVRTSTIVSHFHCVTSPLSPSPDVFQSHSQYMKPVVSQSHYIPCPLCSRYTVYQYLYVPMPLGTSTICPNPSTMSPNHCVPVPQLNTMPIVSQSHCVPVPCVPLTLCTSTICPTHNVYQYHVSHSHCVPVPYVTIPLCTSTICPNPVGYQHHVSQSHCVPIAFPIYEASCIPIILYTMPIMFQIHSVPLHSCPSPTVYQYHMSQLHCVPVPCVPVTLYTSTICSNPSVYQHHVSHSHCVPVPWFPVPSLGLGLRGTGTRRDDPV